MKEPIVFHAPLPSLADGWLQSYTIDDVNISRTCGGVLCADDEHGLGAEREALLQETLAKVAAGAAELRGALGQALDLLDAHRGAYSDAEIEAFEMLEVD